MYKAFLILIGLLICLIKSYSQTEKNTSWGINISSGFSADVYLTADRVPGGQLVMEYNKDNYLLTQSIVFNIHRHSILFGPRLYLPESNISRIGAQLSYEFRLHEKSNKVNKIMTYDIIYSYENDERYINSYYEERSYLGLFTSLGIKSYLTSNLYFNLNFGMGLVFYIYHYMDYEINIMINIGLGYIFK